MEASRRLSQNEARSEPITVTEAEKPKVIRLRDSLEQAQPASGKAYLESPNGDRAELPAPIFEVLLRAAQSMARGNAVAIVPVHHELTTQEAADLLNVSRPHLVKLVETGAIPHHKVGTHRRVYFEDLMRYRAVRDEQRRAALARLTAESQELGLEY